ncbi:MAG: hypothetical protein ACXWCY_22255, partial [Burkholderiales bacterium]
MRTRRLSAAQSITGFQTLTVLRTPDGCMAKLAYGVVIAAISVIPVYAEPKAEAVLNCGFG